MLKPCLGSSADIAVKEIEEVAAQSLGKYHDLVINVSSQERGPTTRRPDTTCLPRGHFGLDPSTTLQVRMTSGSRTTAARRRGECMAPHYNARPRPPDVPHVTACQSGQAPLVAYRRAGFDRTPPCGCWRTRNMRRHTKPD